MLARVGRWVGDHCGSERESVPGGEASTCMVERQDLTVGEGVGPGVAEDVGVCVGAGIRRERGL